MSNLARNNYVEQREYIQGHVSEPLKKSPKVKTSWLTPGEKFLGFVFTVIFSIGAVAIVGNYATLYGLNKDFQDVNKKITEQTKVNTELSMQISELSEYDRIWAKAKEQGLNLNENNMKAVSGK